MRRTPLLLLSLAAACGNPRYDCAARVDPDVALAGPLTDAPFPPFALGVEYMQSGLAPAYADAGATWAKTRLELFTWGATERRAPRGGVHDYNWSCTDDQVGEWQQAGITGVQSYLSPESTWGSAQPGKDWTPKEEHLEDYRAWLRALVERYDGDGADDMPGLVAPLRHWVFGGEWTGFWPVDDAENYRALLDLSGEVIHGADPEAQVGLVPALLIDVFEGNEPTDEEVAERLATPQTHRRSAEAYLEILDDVSNYDYVNVHSLGDYSEIPPTLAWLRAELAARGVEKPLWIDDAFPISFLANDAPGWGPWYPVTADQQDAVFDALDAVARTEDPEATAWVRALTAAGVVHKAVTALGEGAVGIQLGNTEDWMSDTGPRLRGATVGLIGAGAMMGMIDVKHDGLRADDLRQAGDPRPAWENLAALNGLLEGLALDEGALTSERLGENTGVRGYHFDAPGGEAWVLWSEDGALQLPGELEPEVETTLSLPAGVTQLRVTRFAGQPGEAGPTEGVEEAADGQLTLRLRSAPVWVQPVGG